MQAPSRPRTGIRSFPRRKTGGKRDDEADARRIRPPSQLGIGSRSAEPGRISGFGEVFRRQPGRSKLPAEPKRQPVPGWSGSNRRRTVLQTPRCALESDSDQTSRRRRNTSAPAPSCVRFRFRDRSAGRPRRRPTALPLSAVSGERRESTIPNRFSGTSMRFRIRCRGLIRSVQPPGCINLGAAWPSRGRGRVSRTAEVCT